MQAENIISNSACLPYNQLLTVSSLEGMLPSFDTSLWNDHSFKGVVFQSITALLAFNTVEPFNSRLEKLSLSCLCPLHPSWSLLTSSAY